MHFRVHRQGLATPLLRIAAIIMCAIMIVTRGDDFSSFHEYSSQGEAHGAFRGGILTLLMMGCETRGRLGMISVKMVLKR
jgi:hypothetical protein